MEERTFRRFSEEQIERAKRVDVVEYARSVGCEIERSGNWYKAKGQGGLYFNRDGNTWHWEIRRSGGRGAISLCMEFENKSWVEAVRTLLGEEMEAICHSPDWKPELEPPKEFHLPERNYTYRHMFAYLTKTRGIDPGILKVLVDRGYIYENTKRSCVFVGRDKDGTAKHASVRSTNTEGKTFKQDVPGSQKAYSFSISGKSGILNVFEAPIDALSYISLQKFYGKQMKDSYISLGGVTDKALDRFLDDHADIEKIRVCTDNDPHLNPVWDAEEKNTLMKIEKTNTVKELEDGIMFRTYCDYSRFIEKNLDAERHYVVFQKDQLTLSDDGIYTINIGEDQTYTLYNSSNDYDRGVGAKISGRELYNKHFFKLSAGERAAISIQEKYGKKYKVVRNRPAHKDFNEDLVAIRAQEQMKTQEQDKDQERKQQEQSSGQQQEEQQPPEKSQAVEEQPPEDFFIEGKCEILVLCDDKKEIEAYREIYRRAYKEEFELDLEPDEFYLEYRNTEQVRKFMKKYPGIKKLWIATSRTAEGMKAAEDIIQAFGKMEYYRNSPKLDRYSKDLAEMNNLEEALDRISLEETAAMEQAAGMEM